MLSSAKSGAGVIALSGGLNSAAATEFRLECFANTAGDPSGNGEGERFIGTTTVTTDANSDGSFTAMFCVAVSVGQLITATAIDPDNGTSEFSAFVTVEPLGPVDRIQLLITDVQALADAGVLTEKQTNGLTAKLNEALKALGRGNVRVATNKLGDFINQVEGKLSPEDGQPLIDTTQSIIDQLGG